MPRPRKHLATAIQTLSENGEMRMADLAAAMVIAPSVLWTAIKPGVTEGQIVSRKEGKATFLSVGEGVEVPAAEDAEETEQPEISWAHWDHGDIVMYGLVENEDGSHTIPAEVVEAIKRRLAWSPVR